MGMMRCIYILHNKDDMRTAVTAVLCVAIIFGLPPAAVAAPATIAIDESSSIAGPIFRTQPASQSGPRHSDNPTTIIETFETDCDATNLPQEKIQPASTNETTTDTASYAHYNDEDCEDVENDYILFLSWIPIIFLLMLVLLLCLNLQYFCKSRMKKDSVETMCLQSSNSR
ncbi:uncharacterized protein LOC112604300 [Melanaphis sacchari]|uniref:uncharacterized protein LOC112604300 n=1 Tax=Melanaphis sacchari TaxID=742174 RepID=UPI000DC13619|nr:uncharacterized protein LOC112604300 [Melanaphis sacchari]